MSFKKYLALSLSTLFVSGMTLNTSAFCDEDEEEEKMEDESGDKDKNNDESLSDED